MNEGDKLIMIFIAHFAYKVKNKGKVIQQHRLLKMLLGLSLFCVISCGSVAARLPILSTADVLAISGLPPSPVKLLFHS